MTTATTYQRMMLCLHGWVLCNTGGGAIPAYMHDHIMSYLLNGLRPDPGDFLEAVICDLPFSQVVPLADDQNREALLTWHRLLYNVFPSEAWRSRENMDLWIERGGTKGEPLPYLERYVDVED